MCRSRILEDRSLKIERADLSDEGVYICRVENSVGFQESEAKLSVHSKFCSVAKILLVYSCFIRSMTSTLSWWHGIVVKTAGSAGVLSLSCARLAAGRVTSLWVKRPLSVSQ